MTLTDATTGDRYPTRIADRPSRIERTHPTVWPGGPAGPATPQDLADHDRAGYHRVPELLDPDEVQRYWDELARLTNDPAIRADERTIIERFSDEVRSVFDVHRLSPLIAELVRDERVAGRARQVLGSDVYVHQSRINYMPGFRGAGFYWHSDFETWHAEDGMAVPRAVSVSIALTDNYPFNGGLMVLPGSHRSFVSCVGATPDDNYKESLRRQDLGTPDEDTLRAMAHEYGVEQFTGGSGSALVFDCNVLHGSGNNITPFPRSNIFVVFNSVQNPLGEPYAARGRRPEFVASRDTTPVR